MNKTPIVSIIMGSTSDLPIMEKACQFLNDMQIPFEVNALSAHRTPDAVEAFAKGAKSRGIRVIIAGAGMAAALPGVIAASTTLPVIGVPIKGSVLDGMDALYSILQMPPGIPKRADTASACPWPGPSRKPMAEKFTENCFPAKGCGSRLWRPARRSCRPCP